MYPGLDGKYHLWRFLEYLLVGRWQDVESESLVVSRDVIAAYVGVHRSKLSVTRLVEEFSSAVFYVQLSDYDYKNGKARTLESAIPRILLELWMTELESPISHEKRLNVYFATGEIVSDRRQQKLQQVIHKEVEKLAEAYEDRPNISALRYLNGLSSNSFSRLLKDNLDSAIQVAKKSDHPERDLAILKQIVNDPKPVYKPVENTTRLYPLNPSLVSLSREVRKELTSSLIEADLVSAQLQIICKTWQVQTHWVTGAWQGWMEQTRLPVTPRNKQHLKQLVYALIFGMSAKRLRDLGIKSFSERWWSKWRALSTVRALFEARQTEMKRILHDGYVVDAWGERHDLRSWHQPGYKKDLDNMRTLLAAVAQSYEQRLIKAAFDLAETTDEFQIVGYLYDGILVKVRDRRRIEAVCSRLRSAVDKEARELGIRTTLEFTLNGEIIEIGKPWFDELSWTFQ